MNRREALAATAALMGTAIIGSQFFLSGCTSKKKVIKEFNPEMLSLLDQIAETILPVTPSSPGAGACKIGDFMSVIVSDCYSPEDQKIFFDGISILQQTAETQHGDIFERLDDQQRRNLLVAFDKEALNQTQQKEQPTHFFTMLHQLTLWGYFSSEPGATQALRYIPVPGRYDGCIPYNGEAAWLY